MNFNAAANMSSMNAQQTGATAAEDASKKEGDKV
jgi:hypothetical protein